MISRIHSLQTKPSLLSLTISSFPYPETGKISAYEEQITSLWRFSLPNDTRTHGFLLDDVVGKMPWTEDFRIIPGSKEIHLIQKDDPAWETLCTDSIDTLLDNARASGVFPKLGKKRDEKFPIVGAKFPIGIERSASSLFGIIGQGVHMTAYSRTEFGLRFWIPQRNLNKSTYPGQCPIHYVAPVPWEVNLCSSCQTTRSF